MAKLFYITDWNPQPWYNTGGTRAKKYIQSPDGKFYYFKQSQLKEGKDWKFEFWSEVIAYELGTMLGFDHLRYDIAIDGNKIGCLSESMIDRQKEELIEGGKYLNAFDNTFVYEDQKPGEKYTFELIESAIEALQLTAFIPKLLEVFVFDAIIGNGDRHQENWAFIATHTALSKSLAQIEYDLENLPAWLRKTLMVIYKAKKPDDLKTNMKKVKLLLNKDVRFAPIYDSGSSLGRELEDERVVSLLKDQKTLTTYINRGKSEIHWEEKKIPHIEFIAKLKTKYPRNVTEVLDRVKKNFNEKRFQEILNSIDKDVPEEFNKYKIPQERKALILKMVTLRIKSLTET